MESIDIFGIIESTLGAIRNEDKVIPQRTGNLRYNSILLRTTGVNQYQIYINQDIAPYAPYTIEKWISPRWNGKKNPNEGWWDKFCEKIITEIAKSTGGELPKL